MTKNLEKRKVQEDTMKCIRALKMTRVKELQRSVQEQKRTEYTRKVS